MEKTYDDQQSALKLADRSVGRFKKGPRDLSSCNKHLDGFGDAASARPRWAAQS